MNQKILENYAKLAVVVGVNVQKGQPVVISCSTENAYFARLCAKEAYLAGASYVYMMWNDEEITKINLLEASLEDIVEIPDYRVAQLDYFIDKKVCRLNIIGDTPGLLADVDPEKLLKQAINAGEKFKRYRAYSMGNQGQWTIVALPSAGWAKKVFPNDEVDVAVKKLGDAIIMAVKLTEADDPISIWEKHNETLSLRNEILNKYNFKELHFTNNLGTDLVVGLADEHRWAGGAETTVSGVVFNPNIPTEETFTMPHKDRVNGKVVATKPLDYQGKLIRDFGFIFKDGKVVDFFAKENCQALENLLKLDDGSSHLGEVALIAHDSPIQNSGILFYNTLFDENASCHLALGNAYPMNVIGGTAKTEEELEKHGYNKSKAHVDFMFGSEDLKIVGRTFEGEAIVIMENGNFLI